MDFSLSPEVVEFRDEIRSIVREFVTPEIADRMHTTGVFDAPELNLELGRRGILERACPGLGKGDPIEMYVMFNELEKAGAPYDGLAVALMIAAVVNKLGTDEQKERIIPSIISGEALVCMGYSEADFGSDVASIKTRAVKDGDEWVINGSKMWTTLAQVAEWLILLTRTDLDLPKHKGLTMFILPMNTPGITVEPVHTLGTEITNATWYDDVRVGDEAVLGGENNGWRTMTTVLAFERGVMGGTNAGVPLLRHFHEWAEANGVFDEPTTRERMTRSVIDMQVATHDAGFDLTRLSSGAGDIYVPGRLGAEGTPARVRIRARDVMLALEEPRNISALNILRGKVAEISPAGPSSVNVRLDCGGAAVVARITRQSASALGLVPGAPAFAVVKAVSVSGPAAEPR